MRLIDADAFKEYITEACEDLAPFFNDNGKVARLVTESFCKDIDEQPTVSAEPHWIPVTERLPETDKWRTTYLVTTDNGIVTAMEWENTTVRGKSTSRWVWHDRLSPWKVLAWRELPEPYKGVTE
jgi:hypothetical protein